MAAFQGLTPPTRSTPVRPPPAPPPLSLPPAVTQGRIWRGPAGPGAAPQARARSIQALADLEDPPLPVLPEYFQAALGPPTAAGRETRGWPATLDIPTRLTHSLRHPLPIRAWVGLVGRHGGQQAAVLAVASPQLALFVRRRWDTTPWASPLADTGGLAPAPDRERLAGTWVLVEHLLDCAEQARQRGRWPAGLRLALVDDDFGQRSWGWAQAPIAAEAALTPDRMALLRAVAAADRTLQALA